MRLAILSFWLLLWATNLWAGDGHDHDHGHSHDEPEAETAPALQKLESVSGRYELVLKYAPFHHDDTAVMRLYIADFASNAPISPANLVVRCAEAPQTKIAIQALDSGVYELRALFPSEEEYSLQVILGQDSLTLGHIEPSEEHAHSAEEHEHHHHWYTSAPFMLFIGFGFGVGLMFAFRRKPTGTPLGLVLLMIGYECALMPATARAGDDHDHDHGAPAKSSRPNSGNNLEFEIPKETQFLFEIRTQISGSQAFAEATPFYGTILPNESGQASVTAPQAGRLVSIAVQAGQVVRAGQTLATFEQYTNAPENVNIAAQSGTQQLELASAQKRLEAARQELERLRPIKDIASKKDWQNAEAAVQQAQAQVEKLEQFGRDLPQARNKQIALKAPIDGMIEAFAWANNAPINAGQPIFAISNAQRVLVELQIPATDWARIQNSQRFEVLPSSPASSPVTARLRGFLPSLNAHNQTRRAVLELDNPAGAFKLGEFVQVRAFAAEAPQDKAILVPASALSQMEGLPVVFVKIAPERFVLRQVVPSANNGQFARIDKGLGTNERVVAQGTYSTKMVFINR